MANNPHHNSNFNLMLNLKNGLDKASGQPMKVTECRTLNGPNTQTALLNSIQSMPLPQLSLIMKNCQA